MHARRPQPAEPRRHVPRSFTDRLNQVRHREPQVLVGVETRPVDTRHLGDHTAGKVAHLRDVDQVILLHTAPRLRRSPDPEVAGSSISRSPDRLCGRQVLTKPRPRSRISENYPESRLLPCRRRRPDTTRRQPAAIPGPSIAHGPTRCAGRSRLSSWAVPTIGRHPRGRSGARGARCASRRT